jgi:hypothetical protein
MVVGVRTRIILSQSHDGKKKSRQWDLLTTKLTMGGEMGGLPIAKNILFVVVSKLEGHEKYPPNLKVKISPNLKVPVPIGNLTHSDDKALILLF